MCASERQLLIRKEDTQRAEVKLGDGKLDDGKIPGRDRWSGRRCRSETGFLSSSAKLNECGGESITISHRMQPSPATYLQRHLL